jgi:hypothetical protein
VRREESRQKSEWISRRSVAPIFPRTTFSFTKDDREPNPIGVFFRHSHPPIAERLAMAD